MDFFFISRSIDNHECLKESAIAWDVDFIQLSSGSFFCELTQFGDKELSVGDVFLGQHFHQRGSAPPRSYTFAIHRQNSKPHRWRHQDCPLNGMIVFPENNELQSVSLPGFHQFTVSIEETFLSTVAFEIGLPELNHFIKKGEVTLCEPRAIGEIRHFLQSLTNLMKSTSGTLLEPLMNFETKWKIARLFLLTIASSKSVNLRKKRVYKNRIVNRVLEYIDSDLSITRSLPELCRIAEVDERTLRNYFHDIFYTSPQKYIKSYRLNIVKKALLTIDYPQVTIAEIANKNGFWHIGQFAKDYRRLFGELPSETLKNRLSGLPVSAE